MTDMITGASVGRRSLRTLFGGGISAADFATEELAGDPGVSPLMQATALIVGCLVVGAVAWSAVTPVQEMAVTFGEIVPVSAVQTVQHLEGGIVQEILIREGQVVEAGQPLIRFNSVSTQSGHDQLLARRAALSIQAERLAAFAGNRSADFKPFGNYPALIADQASVLSAQFDARENQRRVLNGQIAEQRSQLAAAKSQRTQVAGNVPLLEWKVDMRNDLTSKGFNSKLMVVEAQRELAAARAELHRLDGVIASTKDGIAETEARIRELDGRLRQEALDKQGSVTAELAELDKQLVAQSDRVDRLVSTAPVRGIVQELPVKNEGGVIVPGGMVAKIVPIDDELVADVRISPRDIGFVSPGLPVKVKVAAFDYARYGRLDGTLKSVSPTTFFDKDKNPYYQGRVTLAANHVGDGARNHLILPGMTVEADISTGEKTVLQYLLKPIYTTLDGALRER
ncbi:HlyD family type I secretion periplasmic adaptor subunit [Azospirillum picis]|uniref:Membrane fusion protein (MFP) family protein n=1 Tax=Azospirillum picis TaxID=488438 RepID=A0ABU0MMQ2_9PROT|nr:HlyD family type I secretion periplasmic adaptor subunit [Azospirillum picis]MBP2300650.1 HlyD family secretion protein/adhesin transport system membrane fusion protein [Azospirillum picis]MDQ0534619.1 HlyD family secretion protein/adhesin transport system membrane fusion protein [Azospirillum picis]